MGGTPATLSDNTLPLISVIPVTATVQLSKTMSCAAAVADGASIVILLGSGESEGKDCVVCAGRGGRGGMLS